MFRKLLILLLGFFPSVVFAEGLNASFSGSRIDGLTRSSTVFEYQAAVDASGNLTDVSPENLILNTDAFSAWSVDGTATAIANTARSPVYPYAMIADTVTVGNSTNGLYITATMVTGDIYTPSLYIKRISSSGTLIVGNPVGGGIGEFRIDLATIGDGWVRIYTGCSGSTVNTAAQAVTNAGGIWLYSAAGTISFYAAAAQVQRNDVWHNGPGLYHPNTSVSKPKLNLVPNGSPPSAYSNLQGPDGNRLQARSFQTSNMSGNGTFAAKADKTVGDNPRGTETASLRGNGILDIVTVNYDADTVSVLLGVGNGTFAAQVTYVTGDGPNDVAIGDLRHNGRLDLVVANFAADTVSVLLGNGDGTFAAKVDYATGAVPYDVAVGDLRGTGVLDIVVTNKNDDDISVLLGVGDGTFGAKTDYATGADPQGLALGSLRNNGILDAIVTNMNDDTVSVLLGDGLGAFGAKTDTVCGGGPRGVVVGSLRGNGVLDVLTVNTDDDTVGVLLGDGLGGLAAVVPYGTLDMPYGLEVAKLRGTYLDVVAANYGTNKISVLLGNGTGVLAAKVDYTVESSPCDVAIGSFRGTGVLDLAVSNMGSDTVSVLLGNSVQQYYYKANNAFLPVFDTNYTLTMVVRVEPGETNAMLFSHWSYTTGGILLEYFPGILYVFSDGGGVEKNGYISFMLDDGRYHVISLVRSGNLAQFRIDSNYGPWADVASTGNDITAYTYLAAPNGMKGQILYSRLDAEALSTDRLAYERQQIEAFGSGTGYANPSFSFSRTTSASITYSNGSMAQAAVNVPRVSGSGNGAGVLVEGQGTNKCRQSETFATTWTQVALTSVMSNTTIAPNDTMTADGSVGTAVNTQHGFAQDVTLTAANYTASVYVKPGNFNWVYIADSTVANATAYFNISTGYVGTVGAGIVSTTITPSAYGFYHVSITVLGTAASHTFQLYTAEADTDNSFTGNATTTNTYWWGAQVENQSFPTSYIGPTLAVDVTRTADIMYMDPHVASANKRIIPETLSATVPANKLTIEFNAKCEWPTGSTQGAQRFYITIGGNTGTASITRNYLMMDAFSDGRVYGILLDNASALHSWASAVDPVNFSTWHHVKLFLDFADLSRSNLWVNGVVGPTKVGATGTATFDTTNTLIRLSGSYDGSSGNLDCNVKDLVMETREY